MLILRYLVINLKFAQYTIGVCKCYHRVIGERNLDIVDITNLRWSNGVYVLFFFRNVSLLLIYDVVWPSNFDGEVSRVPYLGLLLFQGEFSVYIHP